MSNQYKITVIQIADLDIDLGIVTKWMKVNGSGEYEIIVKQLTKQNETQEAAE